MVLRLAAAQPVASRRSACRQPAVAERERAAARQPDDGSTAHGDVTARGDETLAAEPLQRRVDGQRLDDAVEVELGAGGTKDEPAGDANLAPAALCRGLR